MGRLWKTVGGKRVQTAEGYRHSYAKWHGTSKYKTERSARNSARRSAERDGRVHKGDGKSIDHINSNPRDNRPSNLRVLSRSANASRHEDSRKRKSKRNKRKWGK